MRVSIITGGGSGIGAAIARRLAGRDECLMLHGQGADAAALTRLKAVAADCQRAGANAARRKITPVARADRTSRHPELVAGSPVGSLRSLGQETQPCRTPPAFGIPRKGPETSSR